VRRLPHRLARPLLIAVVVLGGPACAAAEQLSLPGLDGGSYTLAHWRGRAIVLNFWASWCEPCIAEIPHLVALQKRYRERGLSVVGVGIDDPAKLRNVARTLEINYPVLVANQDRARALLKSWGDKAGVVPYLVLLDGNGQVSATHLGPIDQDGLDEFVEPLMIGKPGRQE